MSHTPGCTSRPRGQLGWAGCSTSWSSPPPSTATTSRRPPSRLTGRCCARPAASPPTSTCWSSCCAEAVVASAVCDTRVAPTDLPAHLVADYTRPGDLVFDPLAGVGTTLVEAVHLGRDAVGMELEPGWAALARANVALARRQGGTGRGHVICGDATRLPRGMPAGLRGQVALVLTSPPYGRTMHGLVDHRNGQIQRFHNTYSAHADEANLGHRRRAGLADGIAAVLAGCLPLLRPSGVMAVVARPWRRDRYLNDLPGLVVDAGLDAGLTLIDCRRPIPAALRDGRLVPRHTFWQLHVAKQTRTKGIPVSLIQHDDIAVFQHLTKSGSSHEHGWSR